MSEWDDDAELALSEAVTRKSAETLQCCMNESWRGRMCSYHQGYDDGYWQARYDLAHPEP